MHSVITSKYQTTVPKSIRERLGIEISDALEWTIEKGKAVVSPTRRDFLRHRNEIRVGAGDIGKDIEKARDARAEKYR